MARFAHIRNNFQMGEVSPKFHGRSGVDKYVQMCKELTNFHPMPQGGVRKRVGSPYVADLATLSMTSAPFYWFPYTYKNESFIVVISGTAIKVFRPSTNSWAGTVSPISTLSWGTYGTNFSYAYTTVVQNDVPAYPQHCQQGDLLFITLGTHTPLCIYATSATQFYYFQPGYTIPIELSGLTLMSEIAHTKMPFLNENLTGITFTCAAPGVGSITMTSSAAYFTADMARSWYSTPGGLRCEGTYFRIRDSSNSLGFGAGYTGVVQVTGFTSSTSVSVDVLRQVPTVAVSTWSESAWSRRRGFPRSVTTKDNRIVYGGSEGFPNTVWASQINDIWELSKADITTSVVASDCSTTTINDAVGSKINFLSDEFDLFMGLTNREMTGEFDSTTPLLLPTTQTDEGSPYIPPIKYDGCMVFADKSVGSIKETIFDYKINKYDAENLTYYADHLWQDSNSNATALGFPVTWKYPWIQKIVYQKSERTIWVTAGYSLFSCTRDKKNGTLAWARHVLGGSISRTDAGFPSTADTINDPIIYDMVCIPSGNNRKSDTLYLYVLRTVNGSTKYYVEKIEAHATGTISDIEGEYLDCSIGASDTAKTTWTNLAAHLPNETVHVIADGNYIGTKTLGATGTLTLTTAASTVHVGYHSDSTLIPVQLESNSLFGSGIGAIKRVESLTILFDRTVNALVGVSSRESDLERINFREMSVPADDPTPLFSGQKTLNVGADYEEVQELIIKQDRPLPMTVLAVVAKGVLYD